MSPLLEWVAAWGQRSNGQETVKGYSACKLVLQLLCGFFLQGYPVPKEGTLTETHRQACQAAPLVYYGDRLWDLLELGIF